MTNLTLQVILGEMLDFEKRYRPKKSEKEPPRSRPQKAPQTPRFFLSFRDFISYFLCRSIFQDPAYRLKWSEGPGLAVLREVLVLWSMLHRQA